MTETNSQKKNSEQIFNVLMSNVKKLNISKLHTIYFTVEMIATSMVKEND